MCGIVGALVARGAVTQGLMDGLAVLEYRGYDSAGLAVVGDDGLAVRKRRGRLAHLEEALADGAMENARAGIGAHLSQVTSNLEITTNGKRE